MNWNQSTFQIARSPALLTQREQIINAVNREIEERIEQGLEINSVMTQVERLRVARGGFTCQHCLIQYPESLAFRFHVALSHEKEMLLIHRYTGERAQLLPPAQAVDSQPQQ